MRILLTNDDGVHAAGILAARQSLASLGEVIVVAPERPRSAAGHAITLHKPLRISELKLSDGSTAYATSGTPADCVSLGHDVVMEGRCDLVVSGINEGPNLGWDVTYSGTVSAAMEGAVLGVMAIAISLVPAGATGRLLDFAPAGRFLGALAARLAGQPPPRHTLLNVNVPEGPGPHRLSFTYQGRREYVDRIVRREDPNGRPYYWQAGSIREDAPDPGSDVHALLQGEISVTPIQLDMTDYKALEAMRAWAW